MDFSEIFANSGLDCITYGAPLKNLTTFHIGGNCAILVEVTSEAEIQKTLALCRQNEVQYFIIGNGSNILASDKGFDGVVIKHGVRFAQVWVEGNSIFAQAGASTKSVFDCAFANGLGGAEFMATIPSSIGGAVFMNAGCFGSEMKDVVKRVWATDGENQFVFSNADAEFAYRDSVFQRNKFVVQKVEFEFGNSSKEFIDKMAKELMTAKRLSQPLDYFSAGSVFKRPKNAFAAQLIDQCGLKGMTIGDAQVSTKHAGFIINKGKATAKDVMILINVVQNKVNEKFGIDLQLELKLLGDTDDIWGLPYAHGVQSW